MQPKGKEPGAGNAPGVRIAVNGRFYSESDPWCDLYLYGRFLVRTSEGKLFLANVAPVPGMVPIASTSFRSWRRCARRLAAYGDRVFWIATGKDIADGATFSYCALWEFGACGVARDVSETSRALQNEVSNPTMGWLWRVPARVFWGYAIKPVGRTALAVLGGLGGSLYALATPACRLSAPVGMSVADAATLGTTVPALLTVVHHPAYAASLFGSRPTPEDARAYWFVTFSPVPERAPSPAQLQLTPNQLKALIHAYIEERKLYLRGEAQRLRLKEARLALEDLQKQILRVRTKLKKVPHLLFSGTGVRFSKEAAKFFQQHLPHYFREKWRAFTAALTEDQKKRIEKEYGSIETEENLKVFKGYVAPYLEGAHDP